MPAVYPGGIKAFTTKFDGAGNIVFAAATNDLQDEVNAVETGLINGLAHVLRPDASANNRDLGLTTARWRDLFLGRTLNIAQGIITVDLKVLDLTATWNAGAVTFTAIKLNITNTDSAAGSLLVDLQVAGDSKFKVDKTGQVTTAGPVVLPANPTTALQAATKQYADLMLPLVGGVSMTGLFNLSGNPTAALHPATKQYADAFYKKRTEVSAENAGSVTIGVPTTVVTVNAGTVAVGDRILVTAKLITTKGATAGRTWIRVKKDSGTATVEFTHNATNAESNIEVAAFTGNFQHISTIVKVTGAGTLILALESESTGSDSTVDIGSGEIYALVLKDQA